MAGIPLFFPPSAPRVMLETNARKIPFRPYHSAGRIEKRKPQRSFAGSTGHLSDQDQIVELRQSRKAIKNKPYAKFARLQRERDALQQEYIDVPADNYNEPEIFRATRFWPSNPTADPKELFAHSLSEFRACSVVTSRPARMVRFDAPDDEILLYTSASCLNQDDALDATTRSAACAGIFKPTGLHPSVSPAFCLRLEHRGPKGGFHMQGSNRAHLRAAIAALQYRPWDSEGWSRVVIASDSEYLVEGITNWVEIWQSNGWITPDEAGYGRDGDPVANRDFWEQLIWEIQERSRRGIEVKFWLILHAQNLEAHAEARFGAEALKAEEYFTPLRGLEA